MKIKIKWNTVNKPFPKCFIFDVNEYFSDEEWNNFSEEEKEIEIERATEHEFEKYIKFYIVSKKIIKEK